MTNLPVEAWQEEAFDKLIKLRWYRVQNPEKSEDEIAGLLGFGSARAMYIQLQNWGWPELRNQYEDKDRQEEILRGSGLEWVIVRPARVTDKRTTGEYQVFLSGDSYKATTISREDVADFMLAQLSEDRYVHKTPVISD